MSTVTLSPKFQIVIPKDVRESMKLTPGQKFHVLRMGNTIELIPDRPIQEYRGFLKGMKNDFEREPDRL